MVNYPNDGNMVVNYENPDVIVRYNHLTILSLSENNWVTSTTDSNHLTLAELNTENCISSKMEQNMRASGEYRF